MVQTLELIRTESSVKALVVRVLQLSNAMQCPIVIVIPCLSRAGIVTKQIKLRSSDQPIVLVFCKITLHLKIWTAGGNVMKK